MPGNIKKDIRTGSLVCTHAYWDCCTRSGTKSVVILPNHDNLKDFTVTRDYVTWWSKVYRLAPTQATNAVIANGPRHQSSKPKENRNVVRANPPHRPNVAPREVECSTNHPAPRDKDLPDTNNCHTQPLEDLEDEGDSMDTHAALGWQSGSSSSQSEEVHFKRRKTNLDLGPTYCDPNAEFPLNSDFLGDVPDSSHPILPYNEVLIQPP